MENQTKLRIFYLYQHLIQSSDAEHPISTTDLIKYMKEEHGIDVNRTTITDDFLIMDKAGIHCEVIKSRQNLYYYDDRLFDVAELKSLVEGRVKSENKNSFIIIDSINEAIDRGFKIRFQYTDYSVHKRKVLKDGGIYYTVSPYDLVWNGDYYYMTGYCDNREHTRTFRIDRIYREVEKLVDVPAVPKPKEYDAAAYSREVFRMFDSDETVPVELSCDAFLMKYVIDQFGIGVNTEAIDENHFIAHVTVCPSPTFYRWVFGWGGKMRITGPEHIKTEYKKMLQEALKNA